MTVEVRSVNNRYLKISCRLSDSIAALEPDVERIVRDHIHRGTVQVAVRFRLIGSVAGQTLQTDLLRTFADQLTQLRHEIGTTECSPIDLSVLAQLPGVVTESDSPVDVSDYRPLVSKTVEEALGQMREFRQAEGASMRSDLLKQADAIHEQIQQISLQALKVVDDYRVRLLERVRRALSESEARIEDTDVIRDVAVFADRCDINEELTRMGSHLKQYREFLDASSSSGRKLEFLAQEMIREVNTIGSKANDVTIAHCVVELKACLERVREILQNVE